MKILVYQLFSIHGTSNVKNYTSVAFLQNFIWWFDEN